jgi:hypothetical protein
MILVNGPYLDTFLGNKDFDIRKSNNARWIDQKVTPDVITIVADCILNYLSIQGMNKVFSSIDIWHNSYTVNNVLGIFKKPSPIEKTAKNEYDKFFQQPMEMLSYAGILQKNKVKNRNFYSLKEKELLEEISLSERTALKFLVKYIKKVLIDSDIYSSFDAFFKQQTKTNFQSLKSVFTQFTKTNTPINGDTEVWRIFIKIINPLAYVYNSLGTEKGRLSKDIISYDMLMYNRDNFRDSYSRKPKGITRQSHTPPSPSKIKYVQYLTDKAMKNVKFINKVYNSNLSEVPGDSEVASETHHIFSRTDFPEISHFLENLINLTPNQHRNHAHPNGNYTIIDSDYQKICLIAKIGTIKKSIENNWGDYDFYNFITVVNIGFKTDKFLSIKQYDYVDLIEMINNY